MNISVSVEAKASAVKVTGEDLIVTLMDGREIKVPLVWFPRLVRATRSQKSSFRFIGGGVGIHWPKLDEDLSVAGILAVR